jgi:hypothetical protein
MSTGSAGARRMRRHTWQILLIGFALIGSVFVAQDLITRYLSASTQERAGRVESASLASVDEVNRIDRDAVQIQLLVTEHIAETNGAAMASIEKDIDAQLLDIEHASRAYEPLIDFRDEASEWAEARASLARFRASVAGALALSRQNLNVEARAQWKASHAAYADLAPTLATLVALNRQEALSAADEIQTAERRTRRGTMSFVSWASAASGGSLIGSLSASWPTNGNLRNRPSASLCKTTISMRSRAVWPMTSKMHLGRR